MASSDLLAQRLRARGVLDVAILLFPEVEVLDFAGPFEVFSVAARLAARDAASGAPPLRVWTVAAEAAPVTARHGLQVLPAHGFDSAPAVDLLLVPGGVVAQPQGDARTLGWVRERAAQAALTASVCTGAFVLGAAGLLHGRRVTTHWEDLDDLRRAHPALDVRGDVPFVDNGDLVCSAGISAGIEMSLHLVGRALGPEWARRTARQMQYAPTAWT